MDYYDFYRSRKDVISQTTDHRLIAVRTTLHDVVLIQEYCNYKRQWSEITRIRFTQNELKYVKELI